MKTHPTFEEISAYHDGESAHAVSIQAHLQQCEACAAQHLALARISSHIQAMPLPEARPGFAANVVGMIREQRQARRKRWVPFGLPAALAAAAAIGAFVLYTPRTEAPRIAENPVNETAPVAVAPAQSAGGYGSDTTWLFASAEDYAYAAPEPEPQNMLLALAAVDWLGADDVRLAGDLDMDTAISRFDDAQMHTFLVLLDDYANEEQTY